MGRKCEVLACYNNETRNISKSFYGFPRDRETCLAWVRFCKSQELDELFDSSGYMGLRYRKICSDHFTPDAFKMPGRLELGLITGAKPACVKVEVVGDYEVYYFDG